MFSGHSTTDKSDTSATRAWSARWPASSKGPIKREPRDPQQARGFPDGRAVHAVASPIRHGMLWFDCMCLLSFCKVLCNFFDDDDELVNPRHRAIS